MSGLSRVAAFLCGLVLLAVGADLMATGLVPEPATPDCDRCGRRRCSRLRVAELCVSCCLTHADNAGAAELHEHALPGTCAGCGKVAEVVPVRMQACDSCAVDVREEMRAHAAAKDAAEKPPEKPAES
ncbi:hypothetical protein [Myxococcus sp. RHSTA-1-4]|uniref:hypothetical protein n=1 Tax=Myxococcus sp. RHSTA-1-4 TaxID=2874601 RepID=UPI001CC18E78|nr:hypothetical protein [Myxococcus sp. RHSTA-1-4]MBZ4422028.1 hypothetical protein [Myxococcus sp. RHSTA-1-4]